MKKAILHSIYGGTIALTAGAAIAVPIVVTKVATKTTKDLLSKIVPLEGPNNSIYERLNDSESNHKGKLNYLAIGDTITAGNDKELSFADFLASDLNKNSILNDYRNFAVKGDRIPEQRARIFRDQAALKALKKADLISVSLGGNDLLAAVEILNLSYNVIRGQSQLDMISAENSIRDKLASSLTMIKERVATPSAYASNHDAANLIKESIVKLEGILDSGSLAGFLDIEQELLDKIFDMIKLDLSTFLAELHGANPNAKIIVIGYPYPFHLLPNSLQNDPIVVQEAHKNEITGDPESYSKVTRMLDGKPATLKAIFNKFVSTLRETVERANYIKFFDANELNEFKDKDQLDRTMPKTFDIHPSLYGSQALANHLFEWIAQDAKLPNQIPYAENSTEELKAIYTYVGEPNFEDHSQNDPLISQVVSILDQPELLKKTGEFVKALVSNPDVFTPEVAGTLLSIIKTPEKLALLMQDLVPKEELMTTMSQILVELNSDDPVATKIDKIIKGTTDEQGDAQDGLILQLFKGTDPSDMTSPRGRIRTLISFLPNLDIVKVLENAGKLIDILTNPTKPDGTPSTDESKAGLALELLGGLYKS